VPDIGPLELIIIVVIALLVFGPGRLGEVGGALGRGLRSFRNEMDGKSDEPASAAHQASPDASACPSCGVANAADAKFCANCGSSMPA
jgi:TatA/E family protein of Tat protein translocase